MSNASYPYSHSGSLFDVTSGSNGSCGSYLCTGGTGFDGPTGLGTPNGWAVGQRPRGTGRGLVVVRRVRRLRQASGKLGAILREVCLADGTRITPDVAENIVGRVRYRASSARAAGADEVHQAQDHR